MRPAPQTEPTPVAPERPDETQPTRQQKARRRSRRRLVVGLLVAAVALAGTGIGLWAVLTGPATVPGAVGSPAITPGRPRLFFQIVGVTADRTGRNTPDVAQDASVEIAGQLSSFYDTVFMDPATWKDGVPDRAWLIFDPSVRERARQDAASFTLGTQGANLQSLRARNASLSVEVLIDPHGNPTAAVATVEFEAAGSIKGANQVTVKNKATFLLEPNGVDWVVFGYPVASTTVETQAVTPSPSQTSSPGASVSPTSPTSTGASP